MPVLFQIQDSDGDQVLKDKLRKIFDHITKRLDSADKTTEIVERVVTTTESGGGSSSLINHHTTHEDGGADEIDVTDLSGLLADKQTPIDHDHSGDAGDGGQLDWDDVWSDAVHTHQSDAEGGKIKLDDWDTPDDNTDLDATNSLHGLMAKTDKSKLDGIEPGATADQSESEIKILSLDKIVCNNDIVVCNNDEVVYI